MEYEYTSTDDVQVQDLSQTDEIPPDLGMQAIDDALDAQEIRVKIWHFQEGEEIKYHAHGEQEELFYVLKGEFSLKLGRSDEAEYIEATEGDFWVAAPMIGHGHRCTSDDGGLVLALGAPPTHDPGLDPHDLSDEEIDEAIEN